uniref:Ig-like domain-containing protein n=1 Tax=Mastacembelus armatus TaxID=205130 RepID=A0A3Q3SKM8_9TELE
MTSQYFTCSEGSTAVLECEITGEPAPEVVWFHNDICLKPISGKYRVEAHDKTYRLYINKFIQTDAGVYKCVARNKMGEVTSFSDVLFQVTEPVEFSGGGGAVGDDGLPQSGRNKTSAVGFTDTVKKPWFCNKTQLLADNRVKMEREGDRISLIIHNITKADQGEYICEAVNYVGEAKSVALVVVVSQEVRFMPVPPTVTHQHVMEFDVEEGDSSRSPSPQEILLEVELDENEVKEFEKQVKIITIPEYTADNKSMVISLDVLPSIYEEGAANSLKSDGQCVSTVWCFHNENQKRHVNDIKSFSVTCATFLKWYQ